MALTLLYNTKGDFRRKSHENRQFFPPPVYFTPPLKGSPWNWVSAQGSEETRMMGYQMVEKVLRYVSRFDTILA